MDELKEPNLEARVLKKFKKSKFCLFISKIIQRTTQTHYFSKNFFGFSMNHL